MDWNLKTMLPAAAASLVAVTSSLSAADDMQVRNLENRVNALEKRGGGMLNPSARPGVRDGSDVFITAAALYWKPNETGLSYAIQEQGSNHNFADCAKVLESRSKYHWGFKVGLGYNMPHDGWDLYLNWTHFRAKNHHFDCCEECDECDECNDCDDCGNCNHCSDNDCDRDNDCNVCGSCDPCGCEDRCEPCERDPCPNIMFPVTVDFAADPIPAGAWNCDAFSRWKLHIDMLDLDLGRDFFVSKYLSLRPFAGLRGLWIRQEQENVYLGMQAAPKFLIGAAPNENAHAAPGSFNTPDVTYFVENEEKYKAIGPRAGMDTLWSFGGGWGLYGSAAISLVYGKLTVEHEESYALGEPISPCDDCECDCECECEIPVLSIQGNRGRCKRQWFTRAVTDIALGLEWDHQFKDDRYHLGFALGWEHHMFFGMNQFLRFHDKLEQGSMTTNQGDLATQGWTLTGRFDF